MVIDTGENIIYDTLGKSQVNSQMFKFQDTYFGLNKNGGLSKRIYEEKENL